MNLPPVVSAEEWQAAHEELLAKQGLYYTLHTLQFQDVSDDEIDEIQKREHP